MDLFLFLNCLVLGSRKNIEIELRVRFEWRNNPIFFPEISIGQIKFEPILSSFVFFDEWLKEPLEIMNIIRISRRKNSLQLFGNVLICVMNTYLLDFLLVWKNSICIKNLFGRSKYYYGCSRYVRLLYSIGYSRITNGTGEIESNTFEWTFRRNFSSKKGFRVPSLRPRKHWFSSSFQFNWHAQKIG